jgi:hypothetical protein
VNLRRFGHLLCGVADASAAVRYESGVMDGREPQPAFEVETELAGRRLEPADLFCLVTVLGALAAGTLGALVESLFLILTAVALLLVRRLRLPTSFELAFAVGIVLQGWGNALWLFERIGWYDKAVHFLTPMLVAPCLYLMLARLGAVPPPWRNGLPRATLGVVVITVSLGFACAAAWELVEGTSDRMLSTGLAHGYFETIDDLYSSLLGSLAGGALLGWLVMTGRDLREEPVDPPLVR